MRLLKGVKKTNFKDVNKLYVLNMFETYIK